MFIYDIYFLIAVGIFILFALAFRVLVLWYWNIDKIVSTLEEIRDELKKNK